MAGKYSDTILTTTGAVVVGATVSAVNSAGKPATLYSDFALSLPISPNSAVVISDADGYVEFYAPDDIYTVTQSFGSASKVLNSIQIYDINALKGIVDGSTFGQATGAAQDAAATATVQAGIATTQASAAATSAGQALVASTLAGNFPNAAATYLPQGVKSATVSNAGTGGTNSTNNFATYSGGTLTYNPVITYDIVGSLIVNFKLVWPGLYLGTGTPTAPTVTLPNAGTGAALALLMGVTIASGQTYWAAAAAGNQELLYGNNGGVVAPWGPTGANSSPQTIIYAPTWLSRARNLFYRGKRLIDATLDANRQLAIGVTADGDVYAPNLVLEAPALAQVTTQANTAIAVERSKRPVQTAFDALAMAAYQPVEFIPCVLDSNGFKGGYGWIGAFQKALTAKYGLFATGAWASGNIGAGNQPVSSGSTFGSTITGLDATLAGFAQPRYPGGYGNVIAGNSYAYTPSGTTYPFSSIGGIILGAVAGVDVTKRYRAHFAYGTFATGSGSFQYQVRNSGAGFGTIASAAVISTNTGAETFVIGTLDVGADITRTVGLQANFALAGQAVIGPQCNFFHRLECLDATAGITCHYTLFAVGGNTNWDAAQYLQTLTDQELTNYLTEVRRLPLLRSSKPRLVFFACMGLNDQNLATPKVPSRGWRALDPTNALAAASASTGAVASAFGTLAASQAASSGSAFLDNTFAFMKRIEEVYQQNEWPDDEVYWLIMPSHVAANEVAGTSLVPIYRAAITEAVGRRARVSVVDLAKLIPNSVISGLWQDSTGFHLTNPFETGGTQVNGYDQIMQNYIMPLIPTL